MNCFGSLYEIGRLGFTIGVSIDVWPEAQLQRVKLSFEHPLVDADWGSRIHSPLLCLLGLRIPGSAWSVAILYWVTNFRADSHETRPDFWGEWYVGLHFLCLGEALLDCYRLFVANSRVQSLQQKLPITAEHLCIMHIRKLHLSISRREARRWVCSFLQEDSIGFFWFDCVLGGMKHKLTLVTNNSLVLHKGKHCLIVVVFH